MVTLIVGAGVSGVIAAISQKRKHPKDKIIIIEHTDKALKKVLATGNGKCNIGNSNIETSLFTNSEYVEQIFDDYSFLNYCNFLSSIGIETKLVDNLLYPISESAITVRNALLSECKKLKIDINYCESIESYSNSSNKINVVTNKNKYEIDKLIFATGGKSLPKSGSDGSIIALLEKHKYNIKPFVSALCPITTNENTSIVNGVRVKANVTLFKNEEKVHSESGEVLFKDHGLSGIVIMNISKIIAEDTKAKYSIKLDILENITEQKIIEYTKEHGDNAFLNAFIHPKLIEYIKSNIKKVLSIKKITFSFKSLADFEFSQVSVGGISINELNDKLESKREKNVFFAGEIVDVAGPCGGYNLTWAIKSALTIR